MGVAGLPQGNEGKAGAGVTGTIPQTMVAIGFDAPGRPDVLRAEEAPVPVPGPGEVLIKVAFAGVNRPDVMQRRGLYPAPEGASPIPGLA